MFNQNSNQAIKMYHVRYNSQEGFWYVRTGFYSSAVFMSFHKEECEAEAKKRNCKLDDVR